MNWWLGRKRRRDIDREVQDHLDLESREQQAAGLDPGDARHAAIRAFGNRASTMEDARAIWTFGWLQRFGQDLRYAGRIMRRSPGFTVIAGLTLALGIGSASTLFSIVYDGLIKDLKPDSDRRIVIMGYYPDRKLYSYRFSDPEYRELLTQTNSLEAIAAVEPHEATLTNDEYPERIRGVRASASVFQEDELTPLIGRTFRPDEDVPGGPQVVLITAELWKSKFHSDPNILGKTIELTQQRYTIIGVTPEHRGIFAGSYVIPLQSSGGDRADRRLWTLALLRKDVTDGRAVAALQAVAARWQERYKNTNPEYAGMRLMIRNLNEWNNAGLMPAIYVLLGAVGLVLLICCANLANLLLARAAARGREIAIRTALGAGRRRIIRQLLTESLLLAIFGGSAGVVISKWGIPVAVALIPSDWFGDREAFHLEPGVVIVVLALSIVMGVLFGLAPALHLSRSGIGEVLKETSSRSGSDRRGRFARSFLIVAETALAVVILAGATLLIESYRALTEMDLGFQPNRLLSMRVTLPQSADYAAFYRKLLPRLATLPGVESASATSGRPLMDRRVDLTLQNFTVEGRSAADPRAMPNADVDVVGADYFRVMGMRLLRGRVFYSGDDSQTARVIVINQTMAAVYWGSADPIGQRIRLLDESPARVSPADSGAGTSATIIGVVADAKQIRILEAPVRPQFFAPITQRPAETRSMTLLLRSRLTAANLASAVRGAVQSIDRQQPVYEVQQMDDAIIEAFGPKRFATALLSFFAALTLALMSVGLYAVLAYSVTQRTQEIGLRMALGARRGTILRSVISQGLKLAAVGLLAGLVITMVLTRVLTGLIYGVSVTDPLTLACVGAFLLLVAFAACIVPAIRAMKLDPIVALRRE